MTIEISREEGITTYYCPMPNCSFYSYDYKYLTKHLKDDHSDHTHKQLKLDSINIFQVIKNDKSKK